MKKSVITLLTLGLAASLLFSSVALASPLMDFSSGKASLDLTWRNTQNTAMDVDFDKKYNFDGGLTFGLGNNFAFQYRNFQPKSANTTYPDGYIANFKLETNEYNVLYKLDNNLAAYAGILNAKGVWDDYAGSWSSDSKNYFQVGVVASAPIAEKTNLWGSVGFGSNLTTYGVGIGYEFSPNWEFNVDYRGIEAKHMYSSYDGSFDAKAKGMGVGVTYKF